MTEMEIMKRLERVEHDNRRLKGFALAALVLTAALSAIYATQPPAQTITAHEFDVVDGSGRVRVRMTVLPSGEPKILLYDPQGKARVGMGVNASGGAVIGFADAQGNTRVGMGVLQSGMPDIRLYDSQGKPRMEMEVVASDVPSITLLDGQGNICVEMDALPSGEPIILVKDAQGFRMDLGSTGTVTPATGVTQQTSAASIVMFGNDEKHSVIWKAP